VHPAADKTPCASGKSCLQDNCVDDVTASTGNCIFGDEYVFENDIPKVVTPKLPPNPTCESTLLYLQSKNIDIVFACQVYLAKRCCDTCASIYSFFFFL
jgi:hypothetical protein